jgi:hypothetical protein
MNAENFFLSKLSIFVRATVLALVTGLLSVIPVATSHATTSSEIGSAQEMAYTGPFGSVTASLRIPANSVPDSYTITFTSAGTADLTQMSLTIQERTHAWVYGVDHFATGLPAEITMPKNIFPRSVIGYSEDGGATWIAIAQVSSSSDIVYSATAAGYVVTGSNLTIYTYHLSTFGAYVPPTVSVKAEDNNTAERAAAKREADKKAARAEITAAITDTKPLTAELFATAEINGVTTANVALVQAEILALPLTSRTDIVQITAIARKYEVVDKIAFSEVRVQAKEFVEIGLIPLESKYKSNLIYAISRLSVQSRSDYASIKAAIDAETKVIEDRKARLAVVIARSQVRK